MHILKILHIIARLNPMGGIATVLEHLVNAQNEIEHFESKVISLETKNNNIENPYFYVFEIGDLKQYLLEDRPDVAIVHSFFHVQYVSVYKELKRQKIPYIIEPHGSFVRNAMLKSKIKKGIANKTIFRRLIKEATAYIYLCEEEMEKSIYHKKHDMIIPNAVEELNVDINKSEDIKFYYIGRYDIHHKGLDLLLDALEILDKRKFVINIDFFGTGTKEQVKYIEERIREMQYVHCGNRGPLTGADKEAVLSTYHIMVLTSRYEGLPMTILEAWNLGIPCVISEGTNMDKIVKENNIGWVSGTTPKEIAECLCKAQNEYTENRNMYIDKCIRFIEENHRWNRIAMISQQCLEQFLRNYTANID